MAGSCRLLTFFRQDSRFDAFSKEPRVRPRKVSLPPLSHHPPLRLGGFAAPLVGPFGCRVFPVALGTRGGGFPPPPAAPASGRHGKGCFGEPRRSPLAPEADRQPGFRTSEGSVHRASWRRKSRPRSSFWNQAISLESFQLPACGDPAFFFIRPDENGADGIRRNTPPDHRSRCCAVALGRGRPIHSVSPMHASEFF